MQRVQSVSSSFIYLDERELCWMFLVLFSTKCLILLTDFPHDVRPSECGGENFQPDRHDAAALPLGRLPSVLGATTSGFPTRLLGVPKRYGCKYCSFFIVFFQKLF